MVGGAPLQPAPTATTVRQHNGQREVPFLLGRSATLEP
jgi:hypothetical protein